MSVEKEKRLGKHPIISVVDGARVLSEWSTIQERGDQLPVMGILPARGMKSLLDKCVGLPKREVEPIIQQNFKHKHLLTPCRAIALPIDSVPRYDGNSRSGDTGPCVND